MLKNCSCKNWGMLLMRLGVAAVFLFHGISKLTDMQMTIGFFSSLGLPAFMAWVVAIVETVGGAAMLFGAFTFIAGIALAIIMFVSIVLVKSGGGFFVFEFELLVMLVSLGLAMTGPGRFSLHGKCNCGNCMMCKGSRCMHGNGAGMEKEMCDGCEMCKNGCTHHEGR